MSEELSIDDVGFAPVTTSEMSSEHTARVAATLDAPCDTATGSALPLLWHWAFFSLPVATAALGPDGHPRMAPGGPAEHLPRRMWAGGRVEAQASLVVGTPVVRRSRISDCQRKSGRSGDLLVVTIEHTIEQEGKVVLFETQDLLYRSPSDTPTAMPIGDHHPEPAAGGWCDTVTMEPTRLFRFSAITFNSHRIHYDAPYATTEEGYPGLVVHGPLTALLLAGSAGARLGPATVFDFRASAPLFAGLPFSLVGEPDEHGAELRAIRNDGTVAMSAHIS